MAFAATPPRRKFPTVLAPRPFLGGEAITPNDSAYCASTYRGIYAAGAGNVNVLLEDGSGPFVFPIAAGGFLDLAVSAVYSTSTTATGILGLH